MCVTRVLTVRTPTALEVQPVASMQTCPLRVVELPRAFQPRMNARHPSLALYASSRALGCQADGMDISRVGQEGD